ncbi:FadR/GntR family transcriptional regulator [Actinomadura decatromicini]|uniref:FadR/GntR family transcriptional regulator n=1 Tax=Actinomadura decatromicini TaxID=2604572 RepID=UPI001CA31D5B|nr:FCD domain-containing protein [Actinomadura decatromicini]
MGVSGDFESSARRVDRRRRPGPAPSAGQRRFLDGRHAHPGGDGARRAARLAARRRTDADLARLAELPRARDAAVDPDEFGAADAAFHLGVAEASGNPVLIEAMRFSIGRLRESMRDIRLDRDVPEAGPAAHRAVLDAIAARDPEAAAAAAAAVVEPTLAVLESLTGGAPR